MTPLPDPPQNNDSELDGETRPIPFSPVITSSDEDESNNEYQPLPQEDEHTDLSCLLNALNTHGINTIADEETTINNETYEEIAPHRSSNTDSSLNKNIDEASKIRHTELAKERELLWSSSQTKKDIVLTAEKETVIKNAMAGFTLPATNVPQWAFDVSEEAWKSKISSITHT